MVIVRQHDRLSFFTTFTANPKSRPGGLNALPERGFSLLASFDLTLPQANAIQLITRTSSPYSRNLGRVPTYYNSSHHKPSTFISKQAPNRRAHQLLSTLIFC